MYQLARIPSQHQVKNLYRLLVSKQTKKNQTKPQLRGQYRGEDPLLWWCEEKTTVLEPEKPLKREDHDRYFFFSTVRCYSTCWGYISARLLDVGITNYFGEADTWDLRSRMASAIIAPRTGRRASDLTRIQCWWRTSTSKTSRGKALQIWEMITHVFSITIGSVTFKSSRVCWWRQNWANKSVQFACISFPHLPSPASGKRNPS